MACLPYPSTLRQPDQAAHLPLYGPPPGSLSSSHSPFDFFIVSPLTITFTPFHAPTSYKGRRAVPSRSRPRFLIHLSTTQHGSLAAANRSPTHSPARLARLLALRVYSWSWLLHLEMDPLNGKVRTDPVPSSREISANFVLLL